MTALRPNRPSGYPVCRHGKFGMPLAANEGCHLKQTKVWCRLPDMQGFRCLQAHHSYSIQTLPFHVSVYTQGLRALQH